MQTLAGIDTTQVYHQFGFDFDQVKDLKLQQYFVHNDAVNWFEELLLNKFREFPFIKIIYERLHHFDINHVTCVEIYYGEHDLEKFEHFKSEMDELIDIAQYKMPWKSDTTYYVRIGVKSTNETVNKEVLNRLNIFFKKRRNLSQDLFHTEILQNCFIQRYKMEVDWDEKHSLTVYELKPNVNVNQLKYVKGFLGSIYVKPIFISEDFMFLKYTEPPIVMKSIVLTVFHNLLSRLTIEDILSLELANKEYRFEWYNIVLDRDIQTHLIQRFSLFHKQNKVKAIITKEVTNQRLRKYFLYKYRDGIPVTEQPKLSRNDSDFTMTGRKSLDFVPFAAIYSAIRFDIISPENITVYSITVLRHNNGNLIKPNSITTREIRLVSDIRSILNEITIPPYFIEITFRSKIKSFYLTDILYTVLNRFSFHYNSIIQLRSYKSRINSCILNSFAKRDYKFDIRFKNIIFDIKRLVYWLRSSMLSNISFSDCIFRLTDKSSRMLKFVIYKFIVCNHSNLTFRNMSFDMSTFSIFLHISHYKIVYDRCCLTSSSSTIIPPKYLEFIVFENMNINFQVLVPILSHVSIEFDNCQIQSNYDPALQVNSIAETFRDNKARFRNMDIDAEILLNISVYIIFMCLDHCRILSNEDVNIPSNYSTSISTIFMDNVEIETKAAAKIFNRFKWAYFIRSQFVCTDLTTPAIPVISDSDLTFDEVSITPEFIKGLKYLKLRNRISFRSCSITNQNLLDIWEAAPRCKRISITQPHLVDYNFYFELIAKRYANGLLAMLQELKDGVAIPFVKLFDIDWPLSESYIDWSNIEIKCVYVNDVTVKLDYWEYGKVLDIPYERYKLLNDLDTCEVDYY